MTDVQTNRQMMTDIRRMSRQSDGRADGQADREAEDELRIVP